MKEAQLQILFGRYLIANPSCESEMHELKRTNKPSLPFSAVRPEQEKRLLRIKQDGYYYLKISDSPIYKGMKTRFTKPKDADSLFVRINAVYIVVFFYKPRKQKIAYCIDIENWINERKRSKRKSLTEDKADFIATLTRSI